MKSIQNALTPRSFRLISLRVLVLLMPLSTQAHLYRPSTGIPPNVQQYIQDNLLAAQRIAGEYGIPVPIILAMGGLESGWGSSLLAREANNHFGIKAYYWDGPVYEVKTTEQLGDGTVYYITAEFRKYESAEGSYRDFAEFIKRTRPEILRIPNYAYERWAISLHQSGYATDISYSKKLIDIIRKYELYRYTYGFEWSSTNR